jgi:hypothetical protein
MKTAPYPRSFNLVLFLGLIIFFLILLATGIELPKEIKDIFHIS